MSDSSGDSQDCERPTKKKCLSKTLPSSEITENPTSDDACQTERPWDIIVVNQIPTNFDQEKFIAIFSKYGCIESTYFCKESSWRGDKHERIAKLKFRNEEDAWKVWEASQQKLIKYDDNVLMITLASDDYSPIQNLPDICLREIFHRVHVKDRFNLEIVCQRWKENARCCWSSITEISTGDWMSPDWSIKSWKVILSRVGDSLKTIRFHLFDDPYEFIGAVAKRCIGLRRMECYIFRMEYELHAPHLCTILEKNSNLCEVQLDFEKANNFDVNIMNVFPVGLQEIGIRIIETNFRSTPVALSRFKKLRVLALHGFNLTKHKSIDSVVNLERLSLKNCKISEKTFSKILKNNGGLKHLHLACNKLCETWFRYVLRLPELRVLVVENENLTDNHLIHLPNLRGLNCIFCCSITDGGIRRLLNPAANITKLWVPTCSITLKSVEIAREWTKRTGQSLLLFPGARICKDYRERIQAESEVEETGRLKVIDYDDLEQVTAGEKWGLELLG